jgi:hypothetical protein
VDQLVPKRKFRRFFQSRVALLLNQVRSVRDCLLNQIHHVNLRLGNVSRRVYHVLAQGRPDVRPETVRIRRQSTPATCKKRLGKGALVFLHTLKSYLSSGKSWAVAMSLFPMLLHIASVSSAREHAGRGG